jgi:hypothetical protein
VLQERLQNPVYDSADVEKEAVIGQQPLAPMQREKLDLGCGNRIISGWLNADHPNNRASSSDVSWDLQRTPWPFAAESSASEV